MLAALRHLLVRGVRRASVGCVRRHQREARCSRRRRAGLRGRDLRLSPGTARWCSTPATACRRGPPRPTRGEFSRAGRRRPRRGRRRRRDRGHARRARGQVVRGRRRRPDRGPGRAALGDRGADVTDGGLDAPVDALLVAGKSGMIDHDVAAETSRPTAIVPLTPLPVTAKAYAVLRRAGVMYVPDFLSLAAPLLASCDGDSAADPVERIRATVAEVASSGADAWLVAVGLAEAFLGTGRTPCPLAARWPDRQPRVVLTGPAAESGTARAPGRARRVWGDRARRRDAPSAPSARWWGCRTGCPSTSRSRPPTKLSPNSSRSRTEPLRWGELVVREAQPEHGDVLRRTLRLHLRQIVVGQSEVTLAAGANGERERRLRQDRSEHGGRRPSSPARTHR